VVELSWDVPTNHVVGMDLWMSSGSRESMQFLKDFAPKRRMLNEVMRFHPHYHVFSMPASDPSVYQELCSDTTGKYCAEDPDASGSVTGRDVLDEDVRQMCIHELTKVSSGQQHNGHDHPPVEYAAPFWDYVEKIMGRCPLDGADADSRFGEVCSKKVMSDAGIDVEAVTKCFGNTRDEKLKNQRDHTAWSPRAVRINGWRYSGLLDADLVTRAVCAGFTKKPEECNSLVSARNPFEKYQGAGGEQVSFTTFIAGLATVAVLAFLMLFCYKRTLQTHLKSSVREEVMLEVQAAMSSYNRMHGQEL